MKIWKNFTKILGWALTGLGFLGLIALIPHAHKYEISFHSTILASFLACIWGFFLLHLHNHEKEDKKN